MNSDFSEKEDLNMVMNIFSLSLKKDGIIDLINLIYIYLVELVWCLLLKKI